MQKRTITFIIIGFLAVVLLAGSFAGGVLAGYLLPKSAQVVTVTEQPAATVPATSTVPPASVAPRTTPTLGNTSTPVDLQTLFRPFWEAWDLVQKQYVDQPIDNDTLMRGAIKGMMESLGDPHSAYMDPEMYKQQVSDMQGAQYDGIGAWVDITGQYLRIISPMPNSPALKAGLKTNDVIVAVDKEDMTGIPGDVVLKKVLGPAGSNVILTIKRGDAKPFDVTIQRAKITVPQVDSRMEANNIAYVHLFQYGDLTTAELKKALNELMAKKPAGLILDLRNNGGGYLNTAIEVLSEFVPANQVVMYEEYGDGRRVTFKSKSGGQATQIPMVVLINEASASASEITAGALQDLGRARLVGVKSYGKGSVQVGHRSKMTRVRYA